MELPTYWDIVQGELIRVLELMVARIAKDPWCALQLYHFGSNSTNAAPPRAGQGRKGRPLVTGLVDCSRLCQWDGCSKRP